MNPLIIVGAGQAAAQLVASLAQDGYAGQVLLLGDEPHLPYQRPPLSKQFLAGELALERLRECTELQDAVTAARRDAMVGQVRQVLVDAPGLGRTVHEAPEIDGVVHVPLDLAVGALVDVEITASEGPDLHARPAGRALVAAALPGAGRVTP